MLANNSARAYLNSMQNQDVWLLIMSSIVGVTGIALAVMIVWKGSRLKRTQSCPGNVWSTVISNFGTGMPRTFQLLLSTRDGQIVSGKFSERRFFWIFPTSPVEGALHEGMTFHRNWINAIYILKILPASDVDVAIE